MKNNNESLHKKIGELIRCGKNDEVLRVLALNKSSVDISAYLLVKKGIVILLTECGRYSIDDAFDYFQKAILVDPDYLPAHIESGWFLLNIKNEPLEALEYFSRIIERKDVQMDFYCEAFEGFLSCVIELEGKKKANIYCENNIYLPEDSKIEIWNKLNLVY